jgi:hypothetical protein
LFVCSRHGHGVAVYLNGDVYHGQFLEDVVGRASSDSSGGACEWMGWAGCDPKLCKQVSGFGTLNCAHANSTGPDPLILVEGQFQDGTSSLFACT